MDQRPIRFQNNEINSGSKPQPRPRIDRVMPTLKIGRLRPIRDSFELIYSGRTSRDFR
jgi:hypothetical protein